MKLARLPVRTYTARMLGKPASRSRPIIRLNSSKTSRDMHLAPCKRPPAQLTCTREIFQPGQPLATACDDADSLQLQLDDLFQKVALVEGVVERLVGEDEKAAAEKAVPEKVAVQQIVEDGSLARELLVVAHKMTIENISSDLTSSFAAPTGLPSTPNLQALVSAIRSITRLHTMPIATLTDLISDVAANSGCSPFALCWRRMSREQAQRALAPFDPLGCGYVDWMEVVTSFILQAYPCIVKTVPGSFADAARMLARADGDMDGLLCEAEWLECSLWFEGGMRVPGFFEDMPTPQASVAGSDDEADALKRLLWSMFSTEGASQSLMNPHLPLLYLSADTDLPRAVKKAVAVLTHSELTWAKVDAQQVAALISPHGPGASPDVRYGAPPPGVSMTCVEEMMAEVGSSKRGTGSANEVGAVQLAYSVQGRRMLESCASRLLLTPWPMLMEPLPRPPFTDS